MARPSIPTLVTSSSSAPTLVDALVPRAREERGARLRAAALVALGVAALALLAQLRVQLGPVPFTGQTLGVLLLGAAYGARLGVGTVLAYTLLGAAGLPLFAGGQGGIAYLLGPTGGYLLGFVLASALLGALASRGWDRSYRRMAVAMVLANLIIYLPGLAWLHAALGGAWEGTLAVGLTPFLVGDALKWAVAVTALPSAWRWLGRR
ncbi:MAG: biotin transporter BioY [Trueperaceae bacterium]